MAAKPQPTKGKATQKRVRRPREEGERLLIQSAVELLDEFDPEEITVRAIASKANVNTRFIGEWFGGKVGLLAAAHRDMITKIPLSGTVDELVGSVTPPLVAKSTRLVVWLVAHGAVGTSVTDVFPALPRLIAQVQQDLGLTEHQSRVAVFQMAAILNFEAMMRPHADFVVTLNDVMQQYFDTLALLGASNETLASKNRLSAPNLSADRN